MNRTRCNVCGRPGVYYLEAPRGTRGTLIQNFCLTHLKRFVGFVL